MQRYQVNQMGFEREHFVSLIILKHIFKSINRSMQKRERNCF